jgi:hypothetical protein
LKSPPIGIDDGPARNRQNKTQMAMTAINSRMAFIDDRIP